MKKLLEKYPWLNSYDGRQTVFYVNLDKDLASKVSEIYSGIEDFINDKEKVQIVYEFDKNQFSLSKTSI